MKALIFDSIYDSYKGVIVYIRVFEGTVKPGDTIRMMATGAEFTLVEVGHMGATNLSPCAQLQAGEVGYLTASIKTVDADGNVVSKPLPRDLITSNRINLSAWARGLGLGTDRAHCYSW